MKNLIMLSCLTFFSANIFANTTVVIEGIGKDKSKCNASVILDKDGNLDGVYYLGTLTKTSRELSSLLTKEVRDYQNEKYEIDNLTKNSEEMGVTFSSWNHLFDEGFSKTVKIDMKGVAFTGGIIKAKIVKKKGIIQSIEIYEGMSIAAITIESTSAICKIENQD